jgi:hypothetical protein
MCYCQGSAGIEGLSSASQLTLRLASLRDLANEDAETGLEHGPIFDDEGRCDEMTEARARSSTDDSLHSSPSLKH